MPASRITIVATGGTIAGKGASASDTAIYQSAQLSVDDLCASAPGLAGLARLRLAQFAAIDSKNATPGFWQKLGQHLQLELSREDVDGVVVTHGTDTLEETAYYLHLTLKTSKPVVLVGAMRPASALSADGPLNLLNAVTVAAAQSSGGRGVLVAMNNQIFGAREVAKTNSMRLDSFSAPDSGPLGLVQDGRVIWLARPERLHTDATRFTVDTPLAAVEILLGYAGTSTALVDAAVAGGAAGIIWAGAGNGSLSTEMQCALTEVATAGGAVIRTTRTGSGYLMPQAGCDDVTLGFACADTLTPWKARVLAMLAIGQGHTQAAALQQIFDTH